MRLELRLSQYVYPRTFLNPHGRHHASLGSQVVDDHHRPREDEQGVRRPHPFAWPAWKFLNVAHGVVREISDGAAPESAKFRRFHRFKLIEPVAEIVERIFRTAGAAPSAHPVPILHDAVSEPPRTPRLGTEKGVPRPRLTSRRRRLEQKGKAGCGRFRPCATQPSERCHGRVGVKENIPPDGQEYARCPAAAPC